MLRQFHINASFKNFCNMLYVSTDHGPVIVAPQFILTQVSTKEQVLKQCRQTLYIKVYYNQKLEIMITHIFTKCDYENKSFWYQKPQLFWIKYDRNKTINGILKQSIHRGSDSHGSHIEDADQLFWQTFHTDVSLYVQQDSSKESRQETDPDRGDFTTQDRVTELAHP